MGQCSSATKQRRGKSNENPAYELQMAEEEEEEEEVVASQLGAPARRRAIDERGDAANKERKANSSNIQDGAPPVEDYGLAAVRPSLDDRTCAALLALRMGRGSSVGGVIVASLHSGDMRTAVSSVDTMGTVPEDACVANAGVKEQEARVGPNQEPCRKRRPLGIRMSDSNERLEQILDLGKTGDAPTVPAKS